MNDKEEIKSFPFIMGDRIDLVVPHSKWANIMCKWNNDPQVRYYMRKMFPSSLDQVKKRLETPEERGLSDFVRFIIYHKTDNRPIGQVGFNRIDWVNLNGNVFGLIGEPKYWGKGIIVEAVELLIKYGFNELNFHKIYAGVYSPNERSLRAAEKLGFKEEGILKEEMYVDGKFVDSHRFALFKKDWLGQKENYE